MKNLDVRSEVGISYHTRDKSTPRSLPMAPSLREPDPSTDVADVRGLRSGDTDTLRRLMDRYWEPLVGFAHRTLGGSGDPEDTVQTAFIRLWSRRDSLTEEGSLKALLYTIVRNACLDDLRKRTRQERAQEIAPPPSSPRTPYEDVHGAELQRVAASAVAQLPERRREVFRLVREEGLSYQEVAELMELSPQTVANHMSLAMADLRTMLKPYFSDSSGNEEDARDRAPDQEPMDG
jgi:RNA polymerase sigma-70 factor (ECF subfamily)